MPATRCRNIVCLPGFGDPLVGERWVSALGELVSPGISVTALDWPGLWTRCTEPVSFARMVDDVRALAGPDTALVGHSLGGLVALQVAAERGAAAAVALHAPRQPSLVQAAALANWRERGIRPTTRWAPNGMAVTFELPSRFADELVEMPAPRLPSCPTLFVFGDEDAQPTATPDAWSDLTGPAGASVLTIERCQHEFMHDGRTRRVTVSAVARFVTGL